MRFNGRTFYHTQHQQTLLQIPLVSKGFYHIQELQLELQTNNHLLIRDFPQTHIRKHYGITIRTLSSISFCSSIKVLDIFSFPDKDFYNPFLHQNSMHLNLAFTKIVGGIKFLNLEFSHLRI